MTMSNFTRGGTLALGFLIVELTVGTRTTNTVFFVVDAKLGYTILLGREWIHANQCVPSMLAPIPFRNRYIVVNSIEH